MCSHGVTMTFHLFLVCYFSFGFSLYLGQSSKQSGIWFIQSSCCVCNKTKQQEFGVSRWPFRSNTTKFYSYCIANWKCPNQYGGRDLLHPGQQSSHCCHCNNLQLASNRYIRLVYHLSKKKEIWKESSRGPRKVPWIY